MPPISSTAANDAVSPGFLADPLVMQLQRKIGPHRSMRGHSQKSSRREVSTSTTREPGDPEGLQEDSFMALSSVQSTEKYSYLSHRAISEAVRDDPRARRSEKGAVLPRLVAVRMDGPGDAEASMYANKGRKGALSAAMTQAARMQPGKASRSSRPNSKQEVRVQLEAKQIDAPDDFMSLDDYLGLSPDGPVRLFQEAALEEEALGLSVPKTRAQPAGRSAGDASEPPSPSSGWSHGRQSEVAARSSRTAGSVLTTRPKECKPMWKEIAVAHLREPLLVHHGSGAVSSSGSLAVNRKVILSVAALEDKNQHLAGPKLLSRLSGEAWRCTEHLSVAELRSDKGWLIVLDCLDKHYRHLPEVDLHESIDDFLFHLKKRPAEGTIAFSARFKTALSRLENLIQQEREAAHAKRRKRGDPRRRLAPASPVESSLEDSDESIHSRAESAGHTDGTDENVEPEPQHLSSLLRPKLHRLDPQHLGRLKLLQRLLQRLDHELDRLLNMRVDETLSAVH
eukprot:s521_g20.t1